MKWISGRLVEGWWGVDEGWLVSVASHQHRLESSLGGEVCVGMMGCSGGRVMAKSGCGGGI